MPSFLVGESVIFHGCLPTWYSGTELQTIIRTVKEMALVLGGRCIHVWACWL
jgi:hypothetical protein